MTSFDGHNTVATCPRCGRRRQLGKHNRTDLCGDCKYVEPNWPDISPPLKSKGMKS